MHKGIMHKKNGGKKLIGPLYESGKSQGEVHGPKGGKAIPDPMGYTGKK